MIKHSMDGQKRLYFYNDKWMGLMQLSRLPECVISRPTLTQRLCMAINNPSRSKWENVKQCLITPTTMGRPGGNVRIKPDFKNPNDGDFIRLMMLMPVYKEEEHEQAASD